MFKLLFLEIMRECGKKLKLLQKKSGILSFPLCCFFQRDSILGEPVSLHVYLCSLLAKMSSKGTYINCLRFVFDLLFLLFTLCS